MDESNLNSIHLELPRREDYRRARQALLDARGCETVQIDLKKTMPRLAHGDTIADAPRAYDEPPESAFVLIDNGREHPLRIGMNSVGRLEDNDVIVADPHVSRRHCAILVHSCHTCEVQDTASKNGTYLNGERVTSPTRLNPGDEIRMCDARMVFQELKQAG